MKHKVGDEVWVKVKVGEVFAHGVDIIQRSGGDDVYFDDGDVFTSKEALDEINSEVDKSLSEDEDEALERIKSAFTDEVWEKVVFNYENNIHKDDISLAAYCVGCDMTDFLLGAFLFNRTLEGEDYWREIYNSL